MMNCISRNKVYKEISRQTIILTGDFIFDETATFTVLFYDSKLIG